MQTEARTVLVINDGGHAMAIRAALEKAGRDDVEVVEGEPHDAPSGGAAWCAGHAPATEAFEKMIPGGGIAKAGTLGRDPNYRRFLAKAVSSLTVVEMTDRNGNRGFGIDACKQSPGICASTPGGRLQVGTLLTRLRERRGFYDVLTGPGHPVPGKIIERRLSFAQARDCARREAVELTKRLRH